MGWWQLVRLGAGLADLVFDAWHDWLLLTWCWVLTLINCGRIQINTLDIEKCRGAEKNNTNINMLENLNYVYESCCECEIDHPVY